MKHTILTILSLVVGLAVGFGASFILQRPEAPVDSAAPVYITSSGLLYRQGNMIKTNPPLPMTYGRNYATSSAVSSPLACQTELDGYGSIAFTPNVTGITLSMAASSTCATTFLPNTGDWTEVLLKNASTTASATFTFAGGTGFNLKKATTTASIISGGVASLKIRRASNTDFDVLFNSGI